MPVEALFLAQNVNSRIRDEIPEFIAVEKQDFMMAVQMTQAHPVLQEPWILSNLTESERLVVKQGDGHGNGESPVASSEMLQAVG